MRGLEAQLDAVLEVAAAEAEATGTVMLSDVPLLDVKYQSGRSSRLYSSRMQNGDLRKYSGSYDNVPESWKSVHYYMDEDVNRLILNVPLDNI